MLMQSQAIKTLVTLHLVTPDGAQLVTFGIYLAVDIQHDTRLVFNAAF